MREAGLDRFDHAAELVDALDVVEAALLHPVRQLFDVIRAAEGVDGVDDSRLVGDDLLRPQRDARRSFGRQRERFVE